MTTNASAQTSAPKKTRKSKTNVTNFFAKYEKVSNNLKSTTITELNNYIHVGKFDELTVLSLIKQTISKVAYAIKNGYSIDKYVLDNYIQWYDNKIADLKEQKAAYEKTVASIKAYQDAKKVYYVAFALTVSDKGGNIIANRGNALPIKACSDMPFITSLIDKSTKAKREKAIKDGEPFTGCVSIVKFTPTTSGKEYFASESAFRIIPTKDGKIELKPLDDCYRGKTVNVLQGVKTAHNYLLK